MKLTLKQALEIALEKTNLYMQCIVKLQTSMFKKMKATCDEDEQNEFDNQLNSVLPSLQKLTNNIVILFEDIEDPVQITGEKEVTFDKKLPCFQVEGSASKMLLLAESIIGVCTIISTQFDNEDIIATIMSSIGNTGSTGLDQLISIQKEDDVIPVVECLQELLGSGMATGIMDGVNNMMQE